MRAGKLRSFVKIRRDVKIDTDRYGQPETVEVNFADSYAEITPLQGRELFNARELLPDVTHRISMRHIPGVTSDMRVTFKGRTFELLGPPTNVDERDREIRFLARERT